MVALALVGNSGLDLGFGGVVLGGFVGCGLDEVGIFNFGDVDDEVDTVEEGTRELFGVVDELIDGAGALAGGAGKATRTRIHG